MNALAEYAPDASSRALSDVSLMPTRSTIPLDLPVFADLPVRFVRFGNGLDVAVHVSGTIGTGKLPLVCLPGYVRNMTDFTDFSSAMGTQLGKDWPRVLIDMPGRGRSGWQRNKTRYTSGDDTEILRAVLSALGLEKAIFVGLGHGGQMIMMLGALRPAVIAGAVIIDAGPLPDPRGLVRQRTNLTHLAALRSQTQVVAALRQILSTDYPGRDERTLDRLAARNQFVAPHGRALPLFDPALVARLSGFAAEDEFEPQWGLFNTLAQMPLMIARTQLTDRLRREVFEEMIRRRPDAISIAIPDQGSPALLDGADETGAITEFVQFVQKRRG